MNPKQSQSKNNETSSLPTANVEAPDWIAETPRESSYDLAMYDDGGAAVQDIDLTRGEFEFLKTQLAVHRGYISAEQQESSEEPGKADGAAAAATPTGLGCSEDEPLIVREAKTHGDKIAAETLIAYTRGAFDSFIQFACATDVYMLHQVLGHAETGPYSLVGTFLNEIGIKLPGGEEE